MVDARMWTKVTCSCSWDIRAQWLFSSTQLEQRHVLCPPFCGMNARPRPWNRRAPDLQSETRHNALQANVAALPQSGQRPSCREIPFAGSLKIDSRCPREDKGIQSSPRQRLFARIGSASVESSYARPLCRCFSRDGKKVMSFSLNLAPRWPSTIPPSTFRVHQLGP